MEPAPSQRAATPGMQRIPVDDSSPLSIYDHIRRNKDAFGQNAAVLSLKPPQPAFMSSNPSPSSPSASELPPSSSTPTVPHVPFVPSAASAASAPSVPSAPSSIAERLGLASLTVLPIPNTDIVATVRRLAEESYHRLEADLSAQDTLIFYGATAAHVDAIEEDEDRPLGRITFFGEEGEKAGLLFLRMTMPVYEVAHLELFLHIWGLISQMGLRKACRPLGASIYKGIGTRKKEGYSGLRPDPPRDFGSDFPSLVIEAGNGESLPRLYQDKDWWFANSPPGGLHGDVKVVLVVKIYRQTKRILLEKWYRGHQSPSQTVTITPHPEKPFSLQDRDLQTNWVVIGAPMVIPFEDVFLRPIWGGSQTDFILLERDLAEWAVGCWRADRRR